MVRRKKSVAVILVITAVISYFQPYLPSFPTVIGNWEVFYWIARMYPIFVTFVLAHVFFDLVKRTENLRFLNFFSFLLIVYFICSSIYFAWVLQSAWANDAVARKLLTIAPDFYNQLVFRFVTPYMYSIVSAVVFFLLLTIIKKFQKKPWITDVDIWVAVFISLGIGPINTLLSFFLGLLLTLLYGLIQQLHKKNPVLVPLYGFIISAWISLFLGRFITFRLFGLL